MIQNLLVMAFIYLVSYMFTIERDWADVNFMNFVKEVNQKKCGKSKENKSFDINPNKTIRHSLDNFDKVLVSNVDI